MPTFSQHELKLRNWCQPGAVYFDCSGSV